MKEYLAADYGLIPGSQENQTKALQHVLDLCRDGGGRVIIPEGSFKISSVRMGSDTEIYLQKGARLVGSENCEEYEVFQLPEGLKLYTDQQAFEYLIEGELYPNYRRAMISAYGEKNISIIGEEGSVIDGADCFDPNGEEHFRGPHGIFFSSCSHVTLKGYTICNSGNFMHETDHCSHVTMENVTSLAGHDGIHLHRSRHVKIANCTFRTGDDCIAGCDVFDLKVSGCTFNTSCNVFRIGGIGILVENCQAEGPGYYPHRLSVIKGRDARFERTDGRHNTLTMMEYFASRNFANAEPSQITVRNCRIKGVDAMMNYRYDQDSALHAGMDLGEIVFENVSFDGLVRSSVVNGNENRPTNIILRNVKTAFADGEDHPLFEAQNARIVQE